MMSFMNSVHLWIHSSTAPTIVRLKVIFTLLGLLEFFTTINKFATRIIIWSSMKKSTIEEIIHHLFRGLLQPCEVFG